MQNENAHFEYKPSEMEGMFEMNQNAQEIRKILIDQTQRKEAMDKLKVQVNEI